jgi:hypothetical protein
MFTGKVFIPISNIIEMDENGHSMSWGIPYRIVNNSVEVRGPIFIPEKKVYDELYSMWYRMEKTYTKVGMK